jgi:hypothetical protein
MTILGMLNSGDRHHLDTVMSLVASVNPSYDYLEIGSYMGASLCGHLTNSKCNSATSVDLRPQGKIKDERSNVNDIFEYNITTHNMLDALRSNNIPIDKLTCIDGTVDDLPKDKKFDLVFIDAEHTNEAVFYDAIHCLTAMKESCIMLFHDDWIVYQGLEKFKDYLNSNNKVYASAKIKGSDIFGIAMGSMIDPFVNYSEQYAEDWENFKKSSAQRLQH